ncbi:MAG: tetratricopeptide repeat protein [Acidobacteria bacterium]|nr:MAG: tetratricopeptide repeat protein [Acidobacteriota bacterium]
MIDLRKPWIWALIAAGLGLGTWLALWISASAPVPPDFPARPEFKTANTSLVALVEAADAQARSHPNSAEDLGRLGKVYHANQFYEPAECAYRIAARLDPADYRWIYYQALVKEESGQAEGQFDLLKKTLQLRPDYAPAFLKQGDIFLKRDNLEEAARCYKASLDAAAGAGSPTALFGLARIAERKGDWRKVVEYLEPVSRDYTSLRPPHQLLANAYEALGNREKAASARAKLLEPNLTPMPPVEDPLHEELVSVCCLSTRLLKEAGLLTRFGHWNQALQVARRAVEVAPEDPDSHHFLARALFDARGGDAEAVNEALAHLNEGLRRRPHDLVPLFYFANFFFKQEKTEVAVEQLRSILAQYPANAEAHFYLGTIVARVGQIDDAVLHYQEALRLKPDYAEPCDKLGQILGGEGRFDEAISYFRKAIRLKPSFVRARANLGVAFEQQGKTGQAIEEFEEALRVKPNDGNSHRCLAVTLLKIGRIKSATDHFREAVRFSPEDPEAHYGFGFALALQENVEQAAEEYREALRLRPGYTEAAHQLQLLDGAK